MKHLRLMCTEGAVQTSGVSDTFAVQKVPTRGIATCLRESELQGVYQRITLRSDGGPATRAPVRAAPVVAPLAAPLGVLQTQVSAGQSPGNGSAMRRCGSRVPTCRPQGLPCTRSVPGMPFPARATTRPQRPHRSRAWTGLHFVGRHAHLARSHGYLDEVDQVEAQDEDKTLH